MSILRNKANAKMIHMARDIPSATMHPKRLFRQAASPEPSFNRSRKDGCELGCRPSNNRVPDTTIILHAINVSNLGGNSEIDMKNAVLINRRGRRDDNARGIVLNRSKQHHGEIGFRCESADVENSKAAGRERKRASKAKNSHYDVISCRIPGESLVRGDYDLWAVSMPVKASRVCVSRIPSRVAGCEGSKFCLQDCASAQGYIAVAYKCR